MHRQSATEINLCGAFAFVRNDLARPPDQKRCKEAVGRARLPFPLMDSALLTRVDCSLLFPLPKHNPQHHNAQSEE